VLAEYPVPVVCNQSVLPIAETARKEPKDFCQNNPDATELFQSCDHCIVTGQQKFRRFAVMKDNVNCVENVRVSAMVLQNFSRKVGLQGREAKTVVAVAFEDELHKPITQSTHAVVQDDRMVQSQDFNRRVGRGFAEIAEKKLTLPNRVDLPLSPANTLPAPAVRVSSGKTR
jgi:hypothetical protein